MWPRYLQASDSSTESGCSNDSDSDTSSIPDSEPGSLMPWGKYESFVEELEKSSDAHEISCTSQTVPSPRMPLDSSDDHIAHSDNIEQSVLLTTFALLSSRPSGNR